MQSEDQSRNSVAFVQGLSSVSRNTNNRIYEFFTELNPTNSFQIKGTREALQETTWGQIKGITETHITWGQIKQV